MNKSSDFMIKDALRKFEYSLYNWEGRIRNQRRPMDALRIASFEPSPVGYIRSHAGLTQPAKDNARSRVEWLLMQKVGQVDADDPDLPHMVRMAQDHWPAVHTCLVAKMDLHTVLIDEPELEPVMRM